VNEPTAANHDRFCQVEGWISVRSQDHVTYELGLPDGRVLRTRVSTRPVYGPELWQHILRDQLHVDEDTFWACVTVGTKPDRGVPQARADALPADLVHFLITRVGLSERTIASMTRKEAIARLDLYWEEGDGA
jgi:hypothetical protein